MEFHDNLRYARRRAGLTQDQLAEALDVSRVAVSNWESGSGLPEGSRLKTLAKVLKTTIGALFDGYDPNTANEPPAGNYPPPPPGMHYPPVVGTAQLGDDGFWFELNYPTGHGDGFVLYPCSDPNAYALRGKGDSMRPRIKPGEFVVAWPNHAYAPGDEVVIRDKRDRVMVKVLNFERADSIEVGSINEDHKPFTIDKSEISVIHYVAGIFKPSMYYNEVFHN
jgi:phage repressor protein C with HTH and peptisase S24 domain